MILTLENTAKAITRASTANLKWQEIIPGLYRVQSSNGVDEYLVEFLCDENGNVMGKCNCPAGIHEQYCCKHLGATLYDYSQKRVALEAMSPAYYWFINQPEIDCFLAVHVTGRKWVEVTTDFGTRQYKLDEFKVLFEKFVPALEEADKNRYNVGLHDEF